MFATMEHVNISHGGFHEEPSNLQQEIHHIDSHRRVAKDLMQDREKMNQKTKSFYYFGCEISYPKTQWCLLLTNFSKTQELK